VPPGIFIPIAEEAGLITDISEWVLRTACTECKRWEALVPDPPRIAINLPALFFRQPDLIDTMLEALAGVGLAPQRVALELTESALLESSASVKGVLDKLRTLGIVLALDDFGTGYSSLSYLNRFPLDELKIDRGFVTHLTEERQSRSIVSAIVAMAHGLDMKVIAEGVETPEQLEFLRRQGCDFVQGYLLSRPLPAERFERFLLESVRLRRAVG
jgi:EAL domain-containing protein (putative c-di-GMP-specific phosphodiesterase class I)